MTVMTFVNFCREQFFILQGGEWRIGAPDKILSGISYLNVVFSTYQSRMPLAFVENKSQVMAHGHLAKDNDMSQKVGEFYLKTKYKLKRKYIFWDNVAQ